MIKRKKSITLTKLSVIVREKIMLCMMKLTTVIRVGR